MDIIYFNANYKLLLDFIYLINFSRYYCLCVLLDFPGCFKIESSKTAFFRKKYNVFACYSVNRSPIITFKGLCKGNGVSKQRCNYSDVVFKVVEYTKNIEKSHDMSCNLVHVNIYRTYLQCLSIFLLWELEIINKKNSV